MHIASVYPNQVDNLIFAQDITLGNQDIFNKYQELLGNKKYIESAMYLKGSGISYYSADLFNLIENMIFTLQTYLQGNVKSDIFIQSDEEPDINEGSFWI